ncbi:MAG: hypothetical protein AABW80_04495 [Nanoarchaeota archaeon]
MEIKGIGEKKTGEEKTKSNAQILGLLLLTLLVVSTVGFAFVSRPAGSDVGNSEANTQQQGQEANGYYSIDLGGKKAYFSYDSDTIKEIPVEINMSANEYVGQVIYYNKGEALRQEIAINIGQFAGRVQEACYGQCEEDLPEKNCNDLLIVWNKTGENNVKQENKCVFINGDLRAVDAFLYKIFEL